VVQDEDEEEKEDNEEAEEEEFEVEMDASSSLQSPTFDASSLARLRRSASFAGRAPRSSHAVGSVRLTAAEPWRAPGIPLMKLSVPSSTIVR
jgi:hypothetical protein